MNFFNIYRLLLAFLTMEKRIMARFDELNNAFDQLALDVRNAMDEITELVDQIKNDPQDQAQVDSLTSRVQALAEGLKEKVDSVKPAPAPAPAPTPTEPTPTEPTPVG